MEIRPSRNIYSGNRCYSQKFWLKFETPSVEQRFRQNFNSLSQSAKGNIGLLVYLAGLLLFGTSSALQIWILTTGLIVAAFLPNNFIKSFFGFTVILASAFGNSITTSEEALAALLPLFVLFGVIWKDFVMCAATLGISCLVITEIQSVSIWILLKPTCFLAFLSFGIEKDFKTIWVLLDTYRRSCSVYYDLFINNPDAVLITDQTTRVLYANHRAKLLLREIGADLSDEIHFVELASLIGVTAIKDIASSCARGSSIEGELTLINKDRSKDEAFQNYIMKASPISWINGNCIRISLVNVSIINLQRKLLLKHTKEAVDLAKVLVRELEVTYASHEVLRWTDMQRVYGFTMNLTNIKSFQMLMSGKVELRMNYFCMQQQLVDKIETIAQKAMAKDIVITLNYSPSLPRIVVGDADKVMHIVKCLVEFAARLAKTKSSIILTCDTKVTNMQTESADKIEVILSLSFVSSQITSEELNQVFMEPCSIGNLYVRSQNYGLGIAILPLTLLALGGNIQDCYAQESTFSRIYVSFM